MVGMHDNLDGEVDVGVGATGLENWNSHCNLTPSSLRRWWVMLVVISVAPLTLIMSLLVKNNTMFLV
jgi:hypothetical protein